METYYDILGLGPDCEEEAIKSAFRKLAKQFHPDLSGEESPESEHFNDLREAYDVLMDAELRAVYDEYLVEISDDFVFVEGHEPEPVWKPSGPETSGGKGFGKFDDSRETPFMFLLWVLLPLIAGGLVMEFFDAPAVAIGAAAGSILLLLWINAEFKRD